MTQQRARHPADLLTGCHLLGRGRGWAFAEMVVTNSHLAEDVPLGWLGTLADVAMAQALVHEVPPDKSIRTTTIRIDAVANISGPVDRFTARGEMLGLSADSGVSRATLYAPSGLIFAVSTARFIVVPKVGHPKNGDPDCPDSDSPPRSTSLSSPGTNFLAATFGATAAEVQGGRSVWTLTPSSRFANSHGTVHGGLHAGLADVAMRSASQSVLSEGSPRLVDLALTYHRPIPIQGGHRLVLQGHVERQGRRVIAATARLESDSGILLTSAQGTFLQSSG